MSLKKKDAISLGRSSHKSGVRSIGGAKKSRLEIGDAIRGRDIRAH